MAESMTATLLTREITSIKAESGGTIDLAFMTRIKLQIMEALRNQDITETESKDLIHLLNPSPLMVA